MNKEILYQSILNEAVQNAYNIYRNYGYVYSEERILRDVEMEYKSRLSKLEYHLKSSDTESKEEKLKPKKLEDIRLELYKLDPDNNEKDREMYERRRWEWFVEEEGKGKPNKLGYVYDDSHKPDPHRTVGIGFDMDQASSRKEWHNAFGENAPDFDEVRNGNRALTETEMEKLFNHSISKREQRLIHDIGKENWQKLKPNERLALESANYNGVVGPELRRRINKYTETGKQEDLDAAFRELVDNESVGKPYVNTELQPRRNREGKLLASHHDKENYIEPALERQMEDSTKKASVSIGQQVPSSLRTNRPYKDGDYFVWQHRSLKPNPNPLHLREDGRIYKVGSEQWSWLNEKKWKGCMCVAEQVDYSKVDVV